MSYEEMYQTYQREICKRCLNKDVCQEELVIKIDNSIKCKNYERKDKHEKMD